MSDLDRIKSKIKAMLDKAAEGSGATEDEAASALEKAMSMMLKYGISRQDVDSHDQEEVTRGEWSNREFLKWHIYTAEAAQYLYNCKLVMIPGKKKAFQFVGLPSNIEMAEITFLWINQQVERLYKEALPPGLDKTTRAELRRTFKLACAMRVRSRAWDIVKRMANDDAMALEYVGSTALVVKSHQEQQLAKVKSFMDALHESGDLRSGSAIKRSKTGIGTRLGFEAGDRVKLNKGLQESRLRLGNS